MIGAASSLSGQEKSTDVIHSPQNWGYLVSLLPGIVSRMARLLRYVAVVALVGVATASLTACSGDPGPIVTDSPSLTRTVEATPSLSPTPTLTSEEELLAQIPEDARGEDFYSASQFAKFFILEYQRMFAEKDSTLFSFLSEPECEFCASSIESYESLVGKGGVREGGVITVSSELAQGGLGDDGFWYVGFALSATENSDYDAAGELVESDTGGDGDVAVKLAWRNGYWHVSGVNVELGAGG